MKKKQKCNDKVSNQPIKNIPDKLNNSKAQIIEAQKLFKQHQFKDSLKHLVQARVSLDQFSWIQLEEIKAADEDLHYRIVHEQTLLLELCH